MTKTRKKQNRRRSRKKKTGWLPAGLITILGVIVFNIYTHITSQAENTNTMALPSTARLMAVVMPEDIPSTMVEYEGMTVSFNPNKHIPNWVAWELTADETTGPIARKNKFQPDPNVAGCAEDYDYLYSGYDRGHMAPAGDMKWSKTAMDETFYLTNICPQVHSLNSGAWSRLEEKCRTWARADSSIIIVCGPVLTDSIRDYLGDNRVAVPKRFFKVILSPYATPMRAIGFIMNNGIVKGGMQQAAVSVDEVEHITGYDFFSALPDSIENDVESKCDFHLWSNITDRKK